MNFDTLPLNRRAIVTINANGLGAAICAGLAWWLWPASPDWWQFGVLSVLLAAQGFICLAAAAKAYLGYRARTRAVAAFAAQGGPLKSASMASRQALVDTGMIDDDA